MLQVKITLTHKETDRWSQLSQWADIVVCCKLSWWILQNNILGWIYSQVALYQIPCNLIKTWPMSVIFRLRAQIPLYLNLIEAWHPCLCIIVLSVYNTQRELLHPLYCSVLVTLQFFHETHEGKDIQGLCLDSRVYWHIGLKPGQWRKQICKVWRGRNGWWRDGYAGCRWRTGGAVWICTIFWVQSVAEIVKHGRLRWFRYVICKSEDDWVSACRL